MQQTHALAEQPSYSGHATQTGDAGSGSSEKRTRYWRGRVAVGALLCLSVAGYALAIFAIDTVVKGGLPQLF